MHSNPWKPYFIFSKKDRNAAIGLVLLIIFISLATFFYQPVGIQQPVVITSLDQELAKQSSDTNALYSSQLDDVSGEEANLTINATAVLFQFDPNTIDAAAFKRLGLPDKTVNTIIKYRSKGGHFWKAADLRKIYGLSKTDADRLIPYVQIATQPTSYPNQSQTSTNRSQPAIIDINTATLEQWKALPAIGDALANRIIKFRDKTGGFNSIAQIKQTYGLSDSAYKAIVPYLTITAVPQKNMVANKININTATVKQLQSNSHIPEEVAQAIVIYRSQHGNFATIADVKKIVFINEEMYRQISPFISVE